MSLFKSTFLDLLSPRLLSNPFYRWTVYLGAFLLLLTAGCIPMLIWEKGELVKIINTYHSPALDTFFQYTTFFGDGLFFVAVGIGMIIWKRKFFLPFAVSGLLHFAVVQLMKKVLFSDSPRPLKFFGEDTVLHLVEGVKVHMNHSFPSGHTTTAFTLAALIFLLFPKKQLFFPCLLFAIIGGVSRIYLLQHFYEDVMTGSILGMLCATIGWYVYMRKNNALK